MYLPPTPRKSVVPRTNEPRSVTPPPLPTISSQAHAPHRKQPSPSRNFLRARSQPSVSQPIEAGLATPPPTSRPTPLIVQETSGALSPRRGLVTSTRHTHPVVDQPPYPTPSSTSDVPKKPKEYKTPIYPWLKATDMLCYFKIEDGVSYRSGQGKWAILLLLFS